jgi:flavorubredoxin
MPQHKALLFSKFPPFKDIYITVDNYHGKQYQAVYQALDMLVDIVQIKRVVKKHEEHDPE